MSEAGHAQFLDEASVVDALAAGRSMAVGCPPRADRMCIPPERSVAAVADVARHLTGRWSASRRLWDQLANIEYLVVGHQRHHRAVGSDTWSSAGSVQVRLVFDGRVGVNDEADLADAARAYMYCVEQEFGTGTVLTVDGGRTSSTGSGRR